MEALTLERKHIDSNPTRGISNRGCNPTSKCTFCGHYKMQRGSVGHCELLNVPVRGGWKSCALAIPAFAPTWEHVESASVGRGAFVNQSPTKCRKNLVETGDMLY